MTIRDARLAAVAAGFVALTLFTACGNGTADDPTAPVTPAATPAATPDSQTDSGSDNPGIPAGQNGETAYCNGATPASAQTTSINLDSASPDAAQAAEQATVSALILKLQASTAGSNASTDTNDPVRVDAVLRRALGNAATQYPNNLFATTGAQAAVQIHHQMSGGAIVIALGITVRQEDAQVLIDTLKLDPLVDYVESDEVEHEESSNAIDAADSIDSTDAANVVASTTAQASINSNALLNSPNDVGYSKQWDLNGPKVGINAPAAWAIQKADPSVVTAIIDSGYQAHEDLDGNRLSTGLTMLASRNIVNTDAIDLSGAGHGTFVAGTMSAVTDNLTGIAGAGWNAKFVPINVFAENSGAKVSDVADAIRWAAGIAIPDAPINTLPAKVINLSLGSLSGCDPAYQSAIDDVVAKGVTVVTSAGNEKSPASWYKPGNCKKVITVAATTRDGQRWRGSNYGRTVSVSAPGAGVLTTAIGPAPTFANLYVKKTGTSFASPIVAGVVALMLSANPNLTPKQVKKILERTAKLPKLGINEQLCTIPPGAGIVDAGAAVQAARAMLNN